MAWLGQGVGELNSTKALGTWLWDGCSHAVCHPPTSLLGALQPVGHREAIVAFLPAFWPFQQKEEGERQVPCGGR